MLASSSSSQLIKEDELFLDRDPQLFGYILQYLRTHSIAAIPKHLKKAVYHEAQELGLRSLELLLNPAAEVSLGKVKFSSKVLLVEGNTIVRTVNGTEISDQQLQMPVLLEKLYSYGYSLASSHQGATPSSLVCILVHDEI
jgi:hypothetical protein